MVGDARRIVLPDLLRFRTGHARLRGLRLLHTHLRDEPLSRDDLVDLALLRLDAVVAIGVAADGLPASANLAHLLPSADEKSAWEIHEPVPTHRLDMDFLSLVRSLEEEMARLHRARTADSKRDRAILASVCTASERRTQEEHLEELKLLAQSAGLTVVDQLVQVRKARDKHYVLGKGKLEDLIIGSLQADADLIIFEQELTALQQRSIADVTDLRVIDRTQLILDIFAQRALSREGKMQVELAQLRYRLPRLVGRNPALSKLAGGIGGRGPGESKLEIDRRRVRDRIHRLEQQIVGLEKSRQTRRSKRRKRRVPILSIIGYTNAGKSTLLNSLTKSEVDTRDLLFATLDPSSKRLRFPKDREVVVTDTVGFIRNLPPELLKAFRTTLEELEDADLFLHVVDASHPQLEEMLGIVRSLLSDLNLDGKKELLVLNKCDLISATEKRNLCRRFSALGVSALNRETLHPMLLRIESLLWGSEKDLQAESQSPPPKSPKATGSPRG